MTVPSTESIIVTISGKQSAAAFSQVMHVLGADAGLNLRDFGQIVVRDRFIATALIASPGARDLIKDALFRAHEAGLTIHFTVAPSLASASSVAPFSTSTSSAGYILTLFAQGTLSPRFLSTVLAALAEAECDVDRINRLTEDCDPYMCLEMHIEVPGGKPEVEALQRKLFEVGRAENNCDVALQKAHVLRRAKRMVVFDLSWTLVQCDAVDTLLEAADRSVAESMTANFAAGNLSGPDWLRERVKLLEGLDADEVNAEATKRLVYTDGAAALCKGLKRLGCRLAVVSSGSKIIAECAKRSLGLDYAFGNVFEVDSDNRFTGEVREPIVDTERKAELVQMLAMQEQIDMEQVIAVGDGPVSAKMLAAAGMSIAFDQPDATDDARSARIASKSLASVLYLLGVTGRDFRRVTAG